MTIALQYCHITVNDPAESLGFYRDALGLEVRNDVASGGFRWVTLGRPDQPGLRDGAGIRCRGAAGADGSAVGATRLRIPRSLGQPGTDLAGTGGVAVNRRPGCRFPGFPVRL
jgi:catechol 2,3-dioxygenase-like lactoylglutathione lyase family enzyme